MIDIEKQKLSIIVISYNQENYIRKTLDSILNQKHNFSFEIIVCDDASKDSTPQIIKDYASQYKEIVPVLRHENQGVVKNYFDAVSRCQGEYLMVCAGDDYWLPGKIAKQVGFMDTHPKVGLCYGDTLKITQWGEKIDSWHGSENNTFDTILKSYNMSACAICQRRALMNTYVKEVDPVSKNWKMEDLPMLLWFSYNSKIEYLPGEVVAYRVAQESISHSKSIDKLIPYLKSIYDVKNYFIQKYNLVSKEEEVDYSYLCDMMSYISIANDNFRNLCLLQLDKCNLSKIKKLIYKLRIKNKLLNKLYCFYVAEVIKIKKVFHK